MLLEGLFGSLVGTTASVYGSIAFLKRSSILYIVVINHKTRGWWHYALETCFSVSSEWCCRENVGLLGLTHIGSRRVVQISTAFMIFFSIFGLFLYLLIISLKNLPLYSSCLYSFVLRCILSGKFGAFFASIPLPIFAAIYCILLGIVGEWKCSRDNFGFWHPILTLIGNPHPCFPRDAAASGITFIQFANSNSMRNIYVLGVSLFLGLSISQYFMMNRTFDGHGPVRTNAVWVCCLLRSFCSPCFLSQSS